MTAISTERLILRDWCEADLQPFATLNADPEVMQYMPSTLTTEQSNALVTRITKDMQVHGFGFWAVEEKSTGDFIGFVGLSRPRFKADFMPCVEIGWRIARNFWGQGYATEAARKASTVGFDTYNLDKIVAFTPVANKRSRRVMEKLGMQHDPTDDFDHPALKTDHPLRRHVLYRLPAVQDNKQNTSYKSACQRCDQSLPGHSTQAYVCSYQCTFCRSCAENTYAWICPNCQGRLSLRDVLR